MLDRLPPPALELQRLLRRRMHLGDRLLTLDMQARWGGPEAQEEAWRLGPELEAEAGRLTGELTALSAQTRLSHPEAFEAWAQAHIALLDRFLADTEDLAARLEAKDQRAGWVSVAAGNRPFVKGNRSYVRYDEELVGQVFGPLPPVD